MRNLWLGSYFLASISLRSFHLYLLCFHCLVPVLHQLHYLSDTKVRVKFLFTESTLYFFQHDLKKVRFWYFFATCAWQFCLWFCCIAIFFNVAVQNVLNYGGYTEKYFLCIKKTYFMLLIKTACEMCVISIDLISVVLDPDVLVGCAFQFGSGAK